MARIPGGYQGAFVPTTNIWDTLELQDIDVTKPEFIELLIRLYQNLNIISQVLNLKDTGYYYPQEIVNGQKFFPNPIDDPRSTTSQTARQVFRSVINFGALPNNTTKSVAHNIVFTTACTLTRAYAASSKTSTQNYVPIPYASASGNDIELNVDGTNVNITTNSNWSAYTITYVIIEYLKN